jgi:hypothetical protein
MKLPTIFVGLFLVIPIPSAKGIDPAGEIERRIVEESERERLKRSGITAADELFAMPDWKTQLASQISRIVEGARYEGPLIKLVAEAKEMEKLKPGSPEARKALEQAMVEQLKLEEKDQGHYQLRNVFLLIGSLRDKRVVPLIAPVLGEKTWSHSRSEIPGMPGPFPPEMGSSSPERSASEVLNELARQGVISADKDSIDVEDWRKWWKENQAKFDPVPEPLRAIDAGVRSSPPPKPDVPAATPSTPAALSPKSQPVPSPTQPAVAAKVEKRQWPVFAAVAAALVGLGVWLVARVRKVR